MASLATIAACTFLFGIFYALVINVEYSVREAQSGVAVTVFFEEGITPERVQEIGNIVKSRPEVSRVDYVTAEESWDTFKVDYLGEYADGYEGDNPLEGSDNYQIYLRDVSKQTSLVAFLEATDGIREVNRSDATADILTNINRLISYVSLIIVGILLAVSLFLIGNTVAMGIAFRKEEIAIMKLIGAKDFVVRAPFVIEGIIIGLFGAALPMIAIYYLYVNVIIVAAERFSVLSDILKFMPVQDFFRQLIPVALIMGVGIGFLGSIFTVRKHLRV